MKKYYDYSVKDVLQHYFQGNTVEKMRGYSEDYHENTKAAFIPLAWKYADFMAVGYFLSDKLLTDTILCDDYIAYIVQEGDTVTAYLSFLHFEDKLPFDLDAEYAFYLLKEWEAKGCNAVIMRNCVSAEECRDGTFSFSSHSYLNAGSDFLIPTAVNNQYIFVRDIGPFWNHAIGLFYSAVTSGLLSEYESLLCKEATVNRCGMRSDCEIANGIYEKTEVFIKGSEAIKDYFDSKINPQVAYVKREEDAAYNTAVIADGNEYVLFVSNENQISQIVEEKICDDETVIVTPGDKLPRDIIMPQIIDVRALDIRQIHAYAVQISTADGNKKNYYLYSEETELVPDIVEIDGFSFDEEILQSVKLVSDWIGGDRKDGALFSNGYFIPDYLLYYRSIPQLIPEQLSGTVYENESFSIKRKYRLPLYKGGWFDRSYKSRTDEYRGANEALVDKNGKRISDYSGYYIDKAAFNNHQIIETRSEANNKTGYLKADGTWLVPPIFDYGESFSHDHCVVAKKAGKQYLVNSSGKIIPFEFEINTNCFCNDICPFRSEKFDGKINYPEEEYFDELSPGCWGYINKDGAVVIEPQFVFATNFGLIDKNHAFAARLIDGKPLWGMIDKSGTEIIECKYPNLATHSGTAVNYQTEEYGLYGIMDINGNIIMEPRYNHIYEYNEEHGLIAAGEEWVQYGVAEISTGNVIIPFEYDYIGFEDRYIECERSSGGTDFFDYDGNALSSEVYLNSFKIAEGYKQWKDRKCGLRDENGKILIPFIFDESKYLDYYLQGFCVTGEKGCYGLNKKDGVKLLDEKYSDITILDKFIIASKRTENNFCILDELYTTDGILIFDDAFRNLQIDNEMLIRETPFGKEFYQMIFK